MTAEYPCGKFTEGVLCYISRREMYVSRREIYVARRETYISRREI